MPNKSAFGLHGMSIIEWVFVRLKRCVKINKIIFALPNSPENDPLEEILRIRGANVYRGSNLDVLNRFACALQNERFDHVIRVCGDRPLIDWHAIDLLIDDHIKNNADYSYNHFPINNNWPIGFGAEICTKKTFDNINLNALTKEYREHIFNYLLDNKEIFEVHTFCVDSKIKLKPNIKLDVDNYADYLRLLRLPIDVNMNMEQILNLRYI